MKGIVLLPAVALLLLTGCGPSGGSSQSSSTNAGDNATKADNVPYIGAMTKAERNAGATSDLATLKPAIEQFQVDKGRFPKDLNELVTEKYISKVPEAPYGMKIDYDQTTGTAKVVKQ
jgi:competence protein ComGC